MLHDSHTWATPKTPATQVTKNINPTYSPEMYGWDFSWLELLEWLKSQPCISEEYVGLMFLVGPPGVALVSPMYVQEQKFTWK